MLHKTPLNPYLKRVGNVIYRHAFPVYAPLYQSYKVFTDRYERALIRQKLRPGMVVVDIGANLGSYVPLFLKLIGREGRLHLFEPTEKSFRFLKKKFRADNRLVLNERAVASHTGQIQLYESTIQNAENKTWNFSGSRAVPTRSVPCVRLDDYFKPGDRVDFIKMDIEGFEFEALRGMTRVLDDNKNIQLLTEFWPYGEACAGRSPEDFLRFFETRGFNVTLVRKNLERIHSAEPLAYDKATGFDVYISRV